MATIKPEKPLTDDEAATTFERFEQNVRRIIAVPKERVAKRKPSRAKAASKARRPAD